MGDWGRDGWAVRLGDGLGIDTAGPHRPEILVRGSQVDDALGAFVFTHGPIAENPPHAHFDFMKIAYVLEGEYVSARRLPEGRSPCHRHVTCLHVTKRGLAMVLKALLCCAGIASSGRLSRSPTPGIGPHRLIGGDHGTDVVVRRGLPDHTARRAPRANTVRTPCVRREAPSPPHHRSLRSASRREAGGGGRGRERAGAAQQLLDWRLEVC
jgi:hypothetical protein